MNGQCMSLSNNFLFKWNMVALMRTYCIFKNSLLWLIYKWTPLNWNIYNDSVESPRQISKNIYLYFKCGKSIKNKKWISRWWRKKNNNCRTKKLLFFHTSLWLYILNFWYECERNKESWNYHSFKNNNNKVYLNSSF